MIEGRCLLCDDPPKPGAAVCEVHARRWAPDHAGRPPERVRALDSRIGGRLPENAAEPKLSPPPPLHDEP